MGQYSNMPHNSKLYRYLDPEESLKKKVGINFKNLLIKICILIGKIGKTLKVQK